MLLTQGSEGKVEGLPGFLIAGKTKGCLKYMAVPVPEAGGEGVSTYIPSPLASA